MKTYAIVMAAGKGTRMVSNQPKVVHEVLYKPMILHIIDALKELQVDQIFVIVGHKAEVVKALVQDDSVHFVIQKEQLGTGHALLQAKDVLANKEGTTIVLNGDAPLITAETLKNLVTYHKKNKNVGTVMTCDCELEKQFGRIIKEDGKVREIVEFKDLQEGQYEITEMNVGEYCFDNKELYKALEKVTNNNKQNEYYITDVIKIMNEDARRVDSFKIGDLAEVGGINNRIELSNATKILQKRVNNQHLLNGVNIVDTDSTYIGTDVIIGTDTTIEPGCIIKGKTIIGDNCRIGPYCELNNVTIKDNVEIKFSVISDSVIENGVDIGPYVRLRNDCHILENVHMGNFVEMKKTTFGTNSKAAHLAYIGDANVGSNVNIGCGTITVNYDGKNKSQTIIKDNSFIGCNSNLVAPVTIGENAYVAAGSTITSEVEENAMAIARARQVNKPGYVSVLEEKRNLKGRK
jgi:UDP-N-acetylglucosamine pyrophosphorylase (EC 2.7.7.23)/glucosamine-1-phosphate N-acetyltransferase (EC 2.3.1.157)